MENVSWLQTLLRARKTTVVETETMVERTSAERKTTIANDLNFRNYVTTEKNKIQKTAER